MQVLGEADFRCVSIRRDDAARNEFILVDAFLTINGCSSPCAAIEAASSSIPSETPVLRTFSFHAVSLFRAISAVSNGMVVMVVSP
jgi:hypothetical protein